MKLLTIVGARPQFIKAASVSRAIRLHNARVGKSSEGRLIEEIIIHTGQHFDANMSEVFFDQLEVPRPHHTLGIASLSHGAMTGRMLEGIETLIQYEHPDWALVYGDTNTTLAGALAAAKLQVPVAHVEAGLRSHNPAMAEEVNRIISDRVSALLLCPTETAVRNLANEGFPFLVAAGATAKNDGTPAALIQRIANVGDVMFDTALHYRELAREHVSLDSYGLQHQGYVLCTVHRKENTDDPVRLNKIFAAFRQINNSLPVVIPLHPRTRAKLAKQNNLRALTGLIILEPLPYLAMQRLQMSARVILTDSGGVQKEAFFYEVPCITLREETEWTETVESGWNRVVKPEIHSIIEAYEGKEIPQCRVRDLYGNGDASEKILCQLLS